jgi:hypothetical protein
MGPGIPLADRKALPVDGLNDGAKKFRWLYFVESPPSDCAFAKKMFPNKKPRHSIFLMNYNYSVLARLEQTRKFGYIPLKVSK